MYSEDHNPAPFFHVDMNYTILSQSSASSAIFPLAGNFLDLVEPSSRRTFVHLITPGREGARVEIYLRTVTNPAKLYEVHGHWLDDARCSLICIEQDVRYQKLQQYIARMQDKFGQVELPRQSSSDRMESVLLRLEQSAAQSDRLASLGQIAASIAHEIRNPLTSIRGLIQLLRPDLQSLGKGNYSDIIIDEIDRVNKIISEFLQSAKPSAPVRLPLAVSNVIDEILLLCHSEALMMGTELSATPIPADLQIWADAAQFKQVLLNIVRNALDAITDRKPIQGGKIHFEAEAVGASIKICVRDNGGGMTDETMAHLYDPFYTTKGTGTGLGLSLCQHIIENHGGSIDVDSVLGLGSFFRIYMPRYMEQEAVE